jgi:hypothetical protein
VACGLGRASRLFFTANSTAIGKKNNAADRLRPCDHRPQGAMQRVPRPVAPLVKWRGGLPAAPCVVRAVPAPAPCCFVQNRWRRMASAWWRWRRQTTCGWWWFSWSHQPTVAERATGRGAFAAVSRRHISPVCCCISALQSCVAVTSTLRAGECASGVGQVVEDRAIWPVITRAQAEQSF